MAQASASEVARVTGTVLVVEDEHTLRLAVSKMLRKKGLSVIEAIDGIAAVELFRANEPDIALVLLDVTLPRMSGPEVFAELRRIRPDIKVIITTAYSQETTVPTVRRPAILGLYPEALSTQRSLELDLAGLSAKRNDRSRCI